MKLFRNGRKKRRRVNKILVIAREKSRTHDGAPRGIKYAWNAVIKNGT